jgi:hypothetical protein
LNNGNGQNQNFANIIEGGGGKGGNGGKGGKGGKSNGNYQGFTNPWKNSSIKETPASLLMFLIQFFGFYLML